MLSFRTIEQLGCAGCYGNQGFQCCAELTLAVLMLLNAEPNFGLPFLQLARLFVVILCSNTLIKAQIEEYGEPIPNLIEFASKTGNGLKVELVFGFVAGLHVSD